MSRVKQIYFKKELPKKENLRKNSEEIIDGEVWHALAQKVKKTLDVLFCEIWKLWMFI